MKNLSLSLWVCVFTTLELQILTQIMCFTYFHWHSFRLNITCCFCLMYWDTFWCTGKSSGILCTSFIILWVVVMETDQCRLYVPSVNGCKSQTFNKTEKNWCKGSVWVCVTYFAIVCYCKDHCYYSYFQICSVVTCVELQAVGLKSSVAP